MNRITGAAMIAQSFNASERQREVLKVADLMGLSMIDRWRHTYP